MSSLPKKRAGGWTVIFLACTGLMHFFIVGPPQLGPALAETLIVPANDLKSGFDYSTPYRGQTFMFAGTVLANRLTVFVSPSIYQSFPFYLLLTEVDTGEGVHPTKVLFEGGPFYILRAGSDFIPYTANLGGIQLTGGRVYAFLLDIFAALSRIDTGTLWQYATLTGMNREAAYEGGAYIYLEPDCTDPFTGLPCGDRGDHFAATWVVDPSADMGFVLEYTPVPPPPPTPAIEFLLLRNK